MFFSIFVGWVVLCVAAGVYASSKGRSGVGIFFLALFLSPLVGFVVAVVMQPDAAAAAESKGMKRCPDCSEFVQAEARICRFCRHEFPLKNIAAAASSAIRTACPKCNLAENTRRYRAGRYTDGWVCNGCRHTWVARSSSGEALTCPKCGNDCPSITSVKRRGLLGIAIATVYWWACANCGYKWEIVEARGSNAKDLFPAQG